MAVERFPLTWPPAWKRTPAYKRQAPRFHCVGSETKRWTDGSSSTWRTKRALSVADATGRVLAECQRLGARDVIISSNLAIRLDGLPRSNQAAPADPGVAVYFRLRGNDRVLACDAYRSVAGNLAAIAAHIDALRAIDRYGVGTLEQAFAGYTALPPDASIDWWVVLGVSRAASIDIIDARWRDLARTAHPDAGGSHDEMARVNAARDAGRAARSQ